MKFLNKEIPFPKHLFKDGKPGAMEFYKKHWEDSSDMEDFCERCETAMGYKSEVDLEKGTVTMIKIKD